MLIVVHADCTYAECYIYAPYAECHGAVWRDTYSERSSRPNSDNDI